jgi:Protein of unknown function (DUF1091)
LSNDSGVF